MARSVGFKKDIRLSVKNSYSGYNTLLLKSFIGTNGDCYDRYLIRMLEMGESLNVCNGIIAKLIKNHQKENYLYQKFINKYQKVKKREYFFMEDTINHFIN